MTRIKHPKDWKSGALCDEEVREFKDIPGTGGIYKISEAGKVVVYREQQGVGRWVAVRWNAHKTGAFSVSIRFDSGRKVVTLARLLMLVFVGPPPAENYRAAHCNGDGQDNRLENLVWATPTAVMRGRIARGTWPHGETAYLAEHSREQIDAIRQIASIPGVPRLLLAQALGESSSFIYGIVAGYTWNDDKWADLADPLDPVEPKEVAYV